MAEALFNRYAGGKARAFSAGTQPAKEVNPTVVEAMREVGMDISRRRPKRLTPEMLDDADRVVTMGCLEANACPATLAPTEDWALEDPEGKPMEKVRKIRDEIEASVKKLIEEMQPEKTGGTQDDKH